MLIRLPLCFLLDTNSGCHTVNATASCSASVLSSAFAAVWLGAVLNMQFWQGAVLVLYLAKSEPVNVVEDVRGALQVIIRSEEFMNMTLAVLMTPE